MYCNQCGAQVEADQAMCPACGRSVIEGRAAVVARSRVAEHIDLLGVLWYVVAFFWIIPAGVMCALAGAAGHFLPETPARPFLPLLFCFLGVVFLGMAIVCFFTGHGLRKLRPWGRTLALVMGFIALLNFPFGTALGIYTLFVLLPEAAGDQYRRMSSGGALYAETVSRPA